MQSTEKNTPKGVQSSNDRKNIIVEKKSVSKNASRKGQFSNNASKCIGLHLLVKNISNKSLFEVAYSSFNDVEFPFLSIIDTEAKQLQAIEDLYNIVKAQPKYLFLKEPEWKGDESPIIVLKWLLKKLVPLACGNRWMIDTYVENGKTRFCFVVYRNYHSQQISGARFWLPMDFLPYLKERDEPLHDLFIDVVALVSRENKIPLWDEDGDFSTHLNQLKNYENSNQFIRKQAISYCSGIANFYLQTIKNRRESVNLLSEFLEKRRWYNVSSQRKENILWWLRKGEELASTKMDIISNTYIPSFIKGNPVTPFRQYKFVWSIHSNDILKAKAFGRYNHDREKSGIHVPIDFKVFKPGDVVNNLKGASVYPVLLESFMKDGFGILLGRYRDYFYKKMLEEQATPTENLIDILDKAEVNSEYNIDNEVTI